MQIMPIISWAADEDDVVITHELNIADDPNFEAMKKQFTAEMNSVDMSEIFANLPNSGDDVELMGAEENTFTDPGMELSREDVITLCNMGYSVKDIEYAINLSKTYGLTPYTLLEMKGITTYDIENNHTSLSGYIDGLSPIHTAYKVNGKTWEEVIAEIPIDEVASLMTVDTASTDKVDLSASYNDYALPSAKYKTITPDLNLKKDGVYIDEKTGNVTVVATDFTLKGKNGMDFSLRRVYNSTNASAYESSVYPVYFWEEEVAEDEEYYAVGFVARLSIKFINGSEEAHRYFFLAEPNDDLPVTKVVLCDQVNIDDWESDYSMFHAIPKQYLYTDEAMAENAVEGISNGECDDWIDRTFEELSAEIKKYSNVSSVIFERIEDTEKYKENLYYDIVRNDDSEYILYETDWVETTTYMNSDIGNGWEFDIPYIEIRESDETAEYYLHFGTKGIFRYNSNTVSGLDNYSYDDLWLVQEDNGWCLYCEDGTEYNFNDAGQLKTQTDKYYNVISYYYEGAGGLRNRLCKVVDTVGRVIELDYIDATEEEDAKVQISVKENENSTDVLHKVTYYKKTEQVGTEVDEYRSFFEDAVTLDKVVFEEDETCEQSTKYTYFFGVYNENPLGLDCYNDPQNTVCLNYALLTNIENDAEQSNYRSLFGTSIAYDAMEQIYEIDGVRTYPVIDMLENDEVCKQYAFNGNRDYGMFINRKEMNLFPYTIIDSWSVGGCAYENCTEQDICQDYEHDRYYHVESTAVLYVPVECEYGEATTNISLEPNSRLNYGYKVIYAHSEDNEQIEVENVYKNITSYDYDKTNIPMNKSYMEYGEYLFDDSIEEIPDILTTGTYKKMYSEKYEWNSSGNLNKKSISVEGEDRETEYKYTYTKDVLKSYQVNDKEISGIELNVINTFDSNNNNIVETIVTEKGVDKKRSTYTYDANNNMLSETHYIKDGNEWVEARTVNYEYDDEKNINLTRTWVENVISDGETSNSDIVSVEYEYDAYDNVVKETDSNGNIYTYTYDKLGRITSAKTPNLGEGEYAFTVDYSINEDDYTYSIVQTDVNGWETEQVYDHYGRLIEIRDIDKGVTLNKYTYPIKAETESYVNTVSTETKYNLNGESATVLNKNGMGGRRVEQYVVDYDGSVISKVVSRVSTEVLDGVAYSVVTTTVAGEDGAPDIVTVEYYNGVGQLKRKVMKHEDRNAQEDDYIETYEYDVFGNLIKTTRDRNDLGTDVKSVIAAEYNFSGQVLSAVDALGNETSYVYNELGEMTQMTDANNNTSYYEYDKLGRLIRERHPFDTVNSEIVYSEISYVYDGNGNVIETNMSSGEVGENEVRKVTTEYNWNNKPLIVTQYNGEDRQITQYSYDNKSQMVRMYTGLSSPLEISGLDNVTGSDSEYSVFGYEYDNCGNVIETTDALGKSESFVYDLDNTLIKKTDRNGTITEYSYDSMGRLLQKNAADGSELYTYEYFIGGNLKEASANGIVTAYEYDDLGRVISESENVGQSIAQKLYDYNSNGNVTSMQLLQGDSVAMDIKYEYDGNGWLKNVYDDDLLVAEYEYYDNGALKSVVNGETNTSYEYNVGNLLTTISNKIGDNIASEYSYTYYIDGNQKTKTDAVNNTTTSYSYNALGYLTEESTPSGIVTYTYDDAGNRMLKTDVDSGVATTYSYDKNNRLKKQTTVDETEIGTFRYTYDDAGNLVMKTAEYYKSDNGGTEGYSVENPGQYVEKYSYNAFGQMTKAVNENNIAEYTYGADGLRRSKTVNGAVTNHIWSGGSIIAETGAEGIVTDKYIRGLGLLYSENESGDKKNYLYNGHGDVVQLVQGSEIVKNYDYTAFGEEIQLNADDDNPFRYCGEYLDSETGFIYLRARYYDSSIGRFTQEDPVKDGLNWYNYCNNCPNMYTDPTGLGPNWDEIKQWLVEAKKWSNEQFLKLVEWWRQTTQSGEADWFLAATLGATPDSENIYHISQESWQSCKYVGYNDFYDWVFDTATKCTGTTMDSIKFPFYYNNKEYILWAWKGDYINLGAGAELGIYYGGEPHWLIDTSLAMPMTLQLLNGEGNQIFYYAPSQKQWWITGFSPDNPMAQAADLTAIYTIDFSQDEKMYWAFKGTYYSERNDSAWSFEDKTFTATLTF